MAFWRRWWARWNVARRFAWRDASKNKGRTALTVAMIGLPVAAVVFLVSLIISSTGTPLTRANATLGQHAQAQVVDVGCGGCAVMQDPSGNGWGWDGSTAPVDRPETNEALRRGLPADAEIVPLAVQSLTVSSATRTTGSLAATSVAPEFAGQIYLAREGELPRTDGEIAIDPYLRDRLNLEVGSTVRIEDRDLVVVGILDARGLPTTSVLALPGTFAQDGDPSAWMVLGESPVTWEQVTALNGEGFMVTSRDVLLNPPPPEPSLGFSGPSQGAEAVGVGAAVVAIVLIEVVLLIGPAFAVGARRRTRQLALVASSGGNSRDLRRIVLASGVVIGTVAGVLGVLVGFAGSALAYVIAQRGDFGQPMLALPWWAAAGGIAFAVGLGALASWMPARAAGRLDVVAALAGRRAEARPHRRVPWLGLAVAVLGIAAATFGAVTGQTLPMVAGIVVLEIGVVLATGGIIALVGRIAPRLGVAGRLALRDATRQRGRTVPAVAAVLAAIAGVTAAAVWTSTNQNLQEQAWEPQLGIGTMALSPAFDGADDVDLTKELQALGRIIEVKTTAPVSLLAGPAREEANDPMGMYMGIWTMPVLPPESECQWGPTTVPTPEQIARCQDVGWSSGGLWHNVQSDGTVVDDGTAVALYGFDDADQAAQAVAQGKAIISNEKYVWADGLVRIDVNLNDDPTGENSTVIRLELEPHVVDWNSTVLILPSAAIQGHDQLTTVPGGLIAQPVSTPTIAQVDQARNELQDMGDAYLQVQMPFQSSLGVILLALIGAAAVVGLGATWLSIGLASAESRPDLATLSAVGAQPRVRRRVVAAQAAVIAVIGVGIGVVLGLILGFILSTSVLNDDSSFYTGQLGIEGSVVVPWLAIVAIAVVIPTLAVGGAWLTAPRKLPLSRRLAT